MEASRADPPPRPRTSLRQLATLRRPADRAFEQLYQQHAREVYQYALALTANPADAEDVTQTTFLNAYRAFEKGERPHKPHNWLITIAHNVCRMRWRQAGSRPREVALDEAPEPTSRDDEQPNLDEVLTALAALSFNQRAAIVMRELEGRSYHEISGVLGVSVSAVEALLFRARRNLQVGRRGLGVLTTVPLPGSLASFIGGGGGAVAAGSAITADLVLKAAAVVAVGAATAGAGYRSVQAMTAPRAAVSVVAVAPKPELDRAAAATRSPNRQASPVRAARPALKQAIAAPSSSGASRPTGPSGSLPASNPTAATPPPPPSVATPPALPTPQLPTPQLPPPPVDIPPVPPLPPLPVTVPIPPLPPLPPPPITPPPIK